jgi:hypothetical protein
MNELQRVKERAKELRLSLEALSTVGKPKRQERPMNEALNEWREGPPLTISPELQSILKPKGAE